MFFFLSFYIFFLVGKEKFLRRVETLCVPMLDLHMFLKCVEEDEESPGPGWCGSAGWASSCKLRDCRIGPQSGCVQEATSQYFSLISISMFLSLFPLSLPLSKISKLILSSGKDKKIKIKKAWIPPAQA